MPLETDVDRIVSISTEAQANADPAFRAEAENEIRMLAGNIREAVEDTRFVPDSGVDADYCHGKLTALQSFSLMAIGAEARESYSQKQILENVKHYANLVKSNGVPRPTRRTL